MYINFDTHFFDLNWKRQMLTKNKLDEQIIIDLNIITTGFPPFWKSQTSLLIRQTDFKSI